MAVAAFRFATAATLATCLLATPGYAQIVPETSGSPAAANSPAAVVQTGSRRRMAEDDDTGHRRGFASRHSEGGIGDPDTGANFLRGIFPGL